MATTLHSFSEGGWDKKEVIFMTVESCSGGSPWKIDAAGVRAAFSLVDHGISVVGIPEEEVLRMSRRLNDAIVAGKAEALLKAWQKEQQASHQA